MSSNSAAVINMKQPVPDNSQEDIFTWLSKPAGEWLKAHSELVSTASFAGNVGSIIGVVSGIYGMWAEQQKLKLIERSTQSLLEKIEGAIIILKNHIHSEFISERVKTSYGEALGAIELVMGIAQNPENMRGPLLSQAINKATTAYTQINVIEDIKERASVGPQMLFCALTLLGVRITILNPKSIYSQLSI